MGNQMQYCCVWQVKKNSWYDILWVSLSFVFKITKSINFYSNFYLLLDHSCIQLFSRVQHLDHVPLWGVQIYDMIRLRLEPQIDPSVPQPVVQSQRRPLLGTKLHEWRVYLQRWFLGFKGMRSVRTLRQKRRSSTKLGSKNCVTIFGAEFGSAAAEYGPIRKKLWRQPSSFKQYFQTKLCTKKMWQNRLRFGRDV